MYLAVADLAEFACEPLQLVLDVSDCVVVQHLAEHPQGAAQPADRHPRVVNRIAAAAQAEVAVEDVVDLFGDVRRQRSACGGAARWW